MHPEKVQRSDVLGVGLAVASGKLLHQSVYLLCLARETELGQKQSQRGDKIHPGEIHLVDVRIHHRLAVAMATIISKETDYIWS